MTSHDNRDNILSDQELHYLLEAEAEMERLAESKRDGPAEAGLPTEEARESIL